MVSNLLLHSNFPGGHLRIGITILFISFSMSSDSKSLLQKSPRPLHRRGQNLASKRWVFDRERYLHFNSPYARHWFVTHVKKT